MPTVATGMPPGIWTVASKASMPCNAPPSTGIPITGNIVWDAQTPAKCAAPPAAAMTTRIPRAAAPLIYSLTTSGVRWADITRTSNDTPNLSNVSKQDWIFGKSDELPINTATCAIFLSFFTYWILCFFLMAKATFSSLPVLLCPVSNPLLLIYPFFLL